jgi:hypothetical protein
MQQESEERDYFMVDLVVVDGVLVELVDDDCSMLRFNIQQSSSSHWQA